ncbi:osmoprotectant ABC transporter substrate-binding protein [Lactobacillus xylocopicola]|uniref:Osmoprotectant ABC transporter substrate-binding protein n=1 Tax=Lactobacillus xylocopicola TaxID=2976676 RepID=A0ABM8BG52_9LACO|nr:osmoprotectant ABC transporter substrate-binding protein [Lactobacillus xylocopicola]
MKNSFKKILLLVLTFLLVIGTSACGLPGLADTQGSKANIRITALTTTESQIVANIVAQLIEHETPYQTTIINNLGSAPMQHQALIRHDADIQAAAYDGGELTANLLLPPIKNAKQANLTVRRQVKKRWDQTYLPSYGFANNYAFMVRKSDQDKYHLQQISDLKRVANKFSFGVASEWVNAPGVGYPAFQTAYGMTFAKAHPMNIGLVYAALKSGKMDVILGYSTDAALIATNFTCLKTTNTFFRPTTAGC